MTLLPLPETFTLDAADRDAFAAYQTAVFRELEKLAELGNYQKRRNTVWQLAWAAVTPQVSQNEVLKRKDTVSKSVFMGKWKKQAGFTAVLQRVTTLTRAYVEGKDGRALERQRENLRKIEHDLSLKIFEKVEHMLAFPLQTASKSSVEKKDVDGRVVEIHHTTVIEPNDRWNMNSPGMMLKRGSDVARRALGMTKDKNELEIDVSQLSDEELDALADGL